MASVSVRYIVYDVAAAIDFYCKHLGFQKMMHRPPDFAMLTRGELRLVLNTPTGAGGGAQAMPDGRKPEPGGWNRIQLEFKDLPAVVERLRSEGVRFRNEIITGIGSRQILVDDPSGNPVELFEPLPPPPKSGPSGT